MSELINKFEFMPGKGGGIQVLYKNFIYNRKLSTRYQCISCNSTILINPYLLTVTKEPYLYFGH